ncbi:MAG: type II toxin-antitoxin system HicB family antitoxin [Deltaproteobacteria bacterium]|jgi:antitoxin HicB|nr:type II toxin-antitoxin system HicB family antitoxin [Deltaproteobacteria bacterium]
MNESEYAVTLTADDNGTWLVACGVLPEVTTYGDTPEEALKNAVLAIEEALAGRMAEGRELPLPEPEAGAFMVRLSVQAALKAALYRAMHREGVSKAELARRLAAHAPQVDRLLNMRHKSRLDAMENALHQLGAHPVLHIAS